jgi:alkaline phosphatase D
MIFNRRDALQAMAAVSATSVLPRALAADAGAATQWRTADNPFRLGVASGFPTDSTVVLWTRVAPDPLAPDGGMPPMDVEVQWEMAADEQFTRGLRRGTTAASVALGHSARVEVQGLSPGRHYWYRFLSGGQRSPVGRTRTLPPAGAPVSALHLAVSCCQHYEHGYYAAFKHMASAAPDAIVHLGDYIYEGAASTGRVRTHLGGLCRTLDDYRQRYSQYQLDPSLQEAHAAAPWLGTWDDHEVANDYSGLTSGRNEDPAVFLARRTAAYQAYFEHQPLPPSAAPRGSETPIFARRSIGALAAIHLLDQRQYRSPPDRTMLGAAQEAWLDRGFASDPASWTFIAQGTVMSHLDQQPGEGRVHSTDAWSGYPAARARLLESLARHRVRNPVVLSGDIHAFMVGNVSAVPERVDTPVVAAEFVATSISSDPRPQRQLDEWRTENPNLLCADGRQRGYISLRLSPQRLTADLIAVDDVKNPASPCRTLQSFVVEAGKPGAQSA